MSQDIRSDKTAGVLLSLGLYVVAFGAAVAAVRLFAPGDPLLVIAVGSAAATTTIFAASVIANNSSMFDPYWSIAPAVVTGYYLWLRLPGLGPREVLVAALVLLYAARLTSNFYRDWPGLTKEDFRYVGFRRRFPRLYWPVSYLGIHLFPASMVYLGCLPLFGIMRSGTASLDALDVAATTVTLGAIIVAFVADEQLRRFRSRPSNRGKGIKTGLWRHSRHPNYLGEITTWWGLYLFALGAGAQWWWTGIGALTITAMFIFVSVPMMERRALSTREGYAEYLKRTPVLLPLRLRR
jgi:steroid 5-alpha reductase family enzyme